MVTTFSFALNGSIKTTVSSYSCRSIHKTELKIETLISKKKYNLKLHKSDFYLTARKYYFIVFLPFGRMTTAATEKTTIRPFPVLVLKIKLLTWI